MSGEPPGDGGIAYVDSDDQRRPGVADRLAERAAPTRAVDDPAAVDGDADAVVLAHDPPAMDAVDLLDGDAVGAPTVVWCVDGAGDDGELLAAGADDVVVGGVDLLAHRLESLLDGDDEAAAFGRLFSATSDAVVETLLNDGRAIIRRANRAFGDLVGADPPELVGRDLDELVLPRGKREDGRELNQRVEDGDTVQLEVTRRTADGPRQLLLRSVPLPDGEVPRAYFVYTDISPRKRREAALRRLNDASPYLLSAGAVDDVATATLETAAMVFSGPSAVYLRDDDVAALRPVASRGVDVPALAVGDGVAGAAYADGEPRVHRADDGEGGPAVDALDAAAVACVPLGEAGVLLAPVERRDAGPADDVELARQLGAIATAALQRADREAQLRDREAELERQNERLEEFASLVSHDLRNPLSVARTRLRSVETDDEAALAPVDDALDRMADLVEGLLALARHGRSVRAPEPVDVAAVAPRAWSLVSTADASFEADDVGEVLADEERLQTLLENCFRNALEHGDAERVFLRPAPDGDGFVVDDDGSGIPEELRDEVFEHGFSTEDGSGLGLAIVETVAAAHGWTVAAGESPEGGARIAVTGVERP
jgi:PAS domain S-box-containing protein